MLKCNVAFMMSLSNKTHLVAAAVKAELLLFFQLIW